jgi:hypothetical protein
MHSQSGRHRHLLDHTFKPVLIPWTRTLKYFETHNELIYEVKST